MRSALRMIVLLFGIVCCGIALVHIAFGHASVPGANPGFSATTDSEDRFYASLFLGFGAALIWCSRNLEARGQCFAALLAVFFVGGLARLISVARVGWPVPLFQALTLLELLMPPLLWWWYRAFYRAGSK